MTEETEPLAPPKGPADPQPPAEASDAPTIVVRQHASAAGGRIFGVRVGDANFAIEVGGVGAACRNVPGRDSSIESADEALKRAAEPEIVNDLLAAGGAIAASAAAAATVAKAKIEATTQRRNNELVAANEQRRIEADVQIAGFQAMRAQTETEGSDPEEA